MQGGGRERVRIRFVFDLFAGSHETNPIAERHDPFALKHMAFAIKIMTAKHWPLIARSDFTRYCSAGVAMRRAVIPQRGRRQLIRAFLYSPGATCCYMKSAVSHLYGHQPGPARRGVRRAPPPGPLATTTWTHFCWAPMPRMSGRGPLRAGSLGQAPRQGRGAGRAP